MKRYSILVTEYFSDHEVELCQVDHDPESIVAALKEKKLKVRRSTIGRYLSIRIVDHGERA